MEPDGAGSILDAVEHPPAPLEQDERWVERRHTAYERVDLCPPIRELDRFVEGHLAARARLRNAEDLAFVLDEVRVGCMHCQFEDAAPDRR